MKVSIINKEYVHCNECKHATLFYYENSGELEGWCNLKNPEFCVGMKILCEDFGSVN